MTRVAVDRHAGWLTTALLAGCGLLTEWLRFGWQRPELWLPDLLTGWCLLGCGVAVSRGPSRRFAGGLLLSASGFLWFLNNLVGNGAVLVWLQQQSGYWHRAPLLHLVITYPTVSARSARRRAAVGSAYAVSVMPWLWSDSRAATALGLLLVAMRAGDVSAARGLARPAAGRALGAALGLATAVSVAPVVRSLVGTAAGAGTTLLVYEALLCAVAVGLAIPLARPVPVPVEIADLMVRVSTTERDTSTLRRELATALGDPSLQLGYWVDDAAAYVDGSGRALGLETAGAQQVVTPVTHQGRPVAVVLHDPSALADPQVRRAVELAVRLGSTNARLRLELAARQGELESSARRIVRAAMDSRERIGRQLRSGAERRLSVVGDLLDAVAGTAGSGASVVAPAQQRLRGAVDDLGRLARGLHPRDLAQQGLAVALAARLADLDAVGRLTVDVPADVPDDLQAMAYFVCAEALTNIAKHAAASTVSVAVGMSGGGELVVEVEDDGCGGARSSTGSGLAGLADRAATYGGWLALESPPGGGTRLAVHVPTGAGR